MDFLDIVGWAVNPFTYLSYKVYRALTDPSHPAPMPGRANTASYGRPVPVVYGRNRVGGNIIWAPKDAWRRDKLLHIDDHEYYLQSMALAICEGPVSLHRVWRDRAVYDSVAQSLPNPSNPDPRIVPLFYSGTRGQASFDYAGNEYLPRTGLANTVKLRVPASAPYTLRIDDPTYQSAPFNGYTVVTEWGLSNQKAGSVINRRLYPIGNSSTVSEAADAGGATFTFDSRWANYWVEIYYLHGLDFTQFAIPYAGTAYLISPMFCLGEQNNLGDTTYEVQGFCESPDQVVVNPAFILNDIITNTVYGLGWSASALEVEHGQDGAVGSSFRRYCDAMGFLLAPAFAEQRPAMEHIRDVLDASNSEMVWTADATSPEGVLRIVPLGDVPVTGNGVTYTPAFWDGSAVVPRYALTADQLLPLDGGAPLQVTRKSDADVFNVCPVGFVDSAAIASDASNVYNASIAEHVLQDVFSAAGLVKKAPTRSLPCITRRDTALQIATIRAQRSCYIRNSYRFRLDWRFAALEPLDLITVDGRPCRIVSVEEDAEGALTFEGEEWPLGACHAAAYATQDGDSGAGQNWAADPLDSRLPVIAVAPQLACLTEDPELWIASGGGPNWGGAQVWLAWDVDGGGNPTGYRLVGEVGRGIFGSVTADLAAGATALDSTNTLSVNLADSGGALATVSASDRDALRSACWVDGEIIAYQSAAQVGSTSVYDLTSLLRGCTGTVSAAHASGVSMMAINDGMLRVPFDRSHEGGTAHVKLVAFNLTRTVFQNLDTVADFSLAVPGSRPVGKLPLSILPEAFNRDDWDVIDGTGFLSIPATDGDTGGPVVASSGQVRLIHRTLIPFEDNKTYAVRIRHLLKTSGSAVRRLYVGLAGVRGDGVTLCDVNGSTSNNAHHFLKTTPDTGGWLAEAGYWRGTAATGTDGGHTTMSSLYVAAEDACGQVNENVKYVRLLLYFNTNDDFTGGNGVQEIEALSLEDATAEWKGDVGTSLAGSALTLAGSKTQVFYYSQRPDASVAGTVDNTYPDVAARGYVLQDRDLWFDTSTYVSTSTGETLTKYKPYRWNFGTQGWDDSHDRSQMVAGEIAAGAIVAAHIDTDAITAVKIKAGEVTAVKLAANAIVGKLLRTETFAEDYPGGPVTRGAILDGTQPDDSIPAARFSPAGIMIGSTIIGNAWFGKLHAAWLRFRYNNGILTVDSSVNIDSVTASGTENAIDIVWSAAPNYTTYDLAFVIANTWQGGERLVKLHEYWPDRRVTVQLQNNTGSPMGTPWSNARWVEALLLMAVAGPSGAYM